MALTDSVLAAVVDADTADQAAADLAVTYAAAIDDGGDLARLGPALLATLEALHMTPRARVRSKVDYDPAPPVAPVAPPEETRPDDGPVRSPLDILRDRRRARTDGTAALDAPPPPA